MSHVNKNLVYIFFIKKIHLFIYQRALPRLVLQSVGASRGRVCYQRGLPHLVLQKVVKLVGGGYTRVCYQCGTLSSCIPSSLKLDGVGPVDNRPSPD